jgi:hypothetical protein
VPPLIVYLDQNKWIELARISNGIDSDMGRSDLLSAIRRAGQARRACFPLSSSHLGELTVIKDVERRRRLAKFMLELSEDDTLLPWNRVIEAELELALQLFLPAQTRLSVKPVPVLGRGFNHAVGTTDPLPLDLDALPPTLANSAKLDMLSSLPFPAPPLPRIGFSESFMSQVAEMRITLSDLPRAEQDETIDDMVMRDLLAPLAEVAYARQIAAAELGAVFSKRREFLDTLPSVRMEIHLMRQWLRDSNLPIKRTDFQDWTSVLVASMYCDVLVTEKLMANLMNRAGSPKRATVTTSLNDLPTLIGA